MYSLSGEYAYDRPFLWGSKRTGPDLHRIGNYRTTDWHENHMMAPADVVPGTIMPAYPHQFTNKADIATAYANANTQKQVFSVPYDKPDMPKLGSWENAKALALEEAKVIVADMKNQDVKNAVANGEIPENFKENPNKLAQKDCDAKWTKKNGQSEYGYKDHIASDQKTKIITKYEVTSASTHDSQVIKDLIDKDDKVIYADSAYKSQEIEEDLKDKNIQSKIIKRAYRNKPLTNQENKENYKHSKTRVRVEHIFGTLTSQFNNALNLTVIGIDRIKSAIGLINLTYNLVRYEQLVRLNKVQIV
jgi:IS5 family transposase